MPDVSRRHVHRLGLASLGATALAAVAADPTKVALLLTGRSTDGGWGQLAHSGIAALQRNSEFKAVSSEGIAEAQIPQVARGYADDGYHLVIGHGFEFGRPLLAIAPVYPKTKFFVSSFLPQPQVPANILYADLAYFDVAYCAGALAALLSGGRKMVGFVGGGDNPTQQRMLRAFVLGAERTVPGIQGRGIVTGDYANAAKGREAAAALIGHGADVIWHAANETGLGALQAAASAKVKALGCYADQLAVAPEAIGTSFLMQLGRMVHTQALAVSEGTFQGGAQWKPSVALMWAPRAGGYGERNPAVIAAAPWEMFQGIWRDVAARRVDVAALLK
jgi:basic membrane protein A